MPAEPDGCRLRLDARALGLGYRLGSDTLLVLLDLAVHATDSPDGPVVAASYRDVARRLGISKDTVGRRVAVLRRAGVLVEHRRSAERFEARSYLLHLAGAGVTREDSGRGVSPLPLGDAGGEALAVLLSGECRTLRRALRPLVWMTLEEVALDAAVEGGRLVARTSARQVAERLGVDPGTAATALRALRERGLVALEREKGPGGRFGLSVYELGPAAGLSVVRPRTAAPLVVSPQVAGTRLEPTTPGGTARRDQPVPGTAGAGSVATPAIAGPDRSGAPRRAGSARVPGHGTAADPAPAQSVQCPGQETFDIGPVSP